MSGYRLDSAALYAAIKTIADYSGKSIREVARETGLSPSTFTRLSQNKAPDAHALLTLLIWLRVSDYTAFAKPARGEKP